MALRNDKVLNFNVGVLGHVDSGKTSLSKALSTVASTAAFDKNPESKERGITIDLGFSSFILEASSALKEQGLEQLQITLVDCPGHASLIKTIIGGSQIINLMMLVIDVTKGIQTQTAECLIIGQITSDRMIIVLNKIDMLPPEKCVGMIDKMKKKLRLTLQTTKFKDCEMIAVSAKPGGPDSDSKPQGLDHLVEALQKNAYVPYTRNDGAALFAVDHCFPIKGQGTILTGTVLQGSIKVGDSLEIPSLATVKKVKSMQMFRKAVDRISQGDRAGVCVTQFDAALLERGLACTPGSAPLTYAIIIDLSSIPYYKGEIRSKAKFHISLGHETVMSKITMFKQHTQTSASFDVQSEFEFIEELSVDDKAGHNFMLIEFERGVPVVPNCIVIGSKLDTDINANNCRLAFHGRVQWSTCDREYSKTSLPKLKIFKNKCKEGVVERATNEYEIVVKDLVKKESNIELFTGLKVELSTGEIGTIEGSFGQSGKLKARVLSGLASETYSRVGSKKKKTETAVTSEPVTIKLKFKRYIFDMSKKMIQN